MPVNLDLGAPSVHLPLLRSCDPHCNGVAASSLPLRYACGDDCEFLAGNYACVCDEGASSHQMGDPSASPVDDGGGEC